MASEDTIKLLRECDAGIKMGVASLDEVLDCISAEELKHRLVAYKAEHEKLREEVQRRLAELGDDGKEPSPMAKGMSWMTTNVKLAMERSDHMVADLMTDGCNMGVKSLSRYLNEYQAADEAAKDVAGRLIDLEEQLARDIRAYL